jgi:hypothetical protein
MSLIDEARDHLEAADRIGTSKPMSEYLVQLGNAKATLALAEQQAAANKIAILAADNSDFFFLMPEKAGRPEMYGSAAGALLADVQKALGFWEPEAGEDDD